MDGTIVHAKTKTTLIQVTTLKTYGKYYGLDYSHDNIHIVTV